jgi:hypothetical protein
LLLTAELEELGRKFLEILANLKNSGESKSDGWIRVSRPSLQKNCLAGFKTKFDRSMSRWKLEGVEWKHFGTGSDNKLWVRLT